MATVSKHHVHASLEGYRRKGGDTQALLLRAGINPSTLGGTNLRVHTDQVGRLFRLVQQEMNDEFMGFTEHPCEFGTFATFCQLAKRSADLGELLDRQRDVAEDAHDGDHQRDHQSEFRPVDEER